MNVNPLFLEDAAAWIEIDAVNNGLFAEVLFPHLQRSAVVASDLENRYRLVSEAFEVGFVDWEIMLPLMNQPAGIIIEVPLEIVIWVKHRSGWFQSGAE